MPNPKIEWLKKGDSSFLKFTFSGKLTAAEANVSIKVWEYYFHLCPDEKISILWDCLEMKGYDRQAREQWQKALKDMHSRIDCIWLITNSSLVRMGASLMSLTATYKINIISSEDGLPYTMPDN